MTGWYLIATAVGIFAAGVAGYIRGYGDGYHDAIRKLRP